MLRVISTPQTPPTTTNPTSLRHHTPYTKDPSKIGKAQKPYDAYALTKHTYLLNIGTYKYSNPYANLPILIPIPIRSSYVYGWRPCESWDIYTEIPVFRSRPYQTQAFQDLYRDSRGPVQEEEQQCEDRYIPETRSSTRIST